MASIHHTAIVESSVKLDEGVSVGPYSILKGNVEIGSETVIHSHVCIEGNTKIGHHCEIFPFASIGSKPQDHKFHGETTYLEIGDHNIIREYVTINPGTEHGGGITKIGNHNLLMISSHIGHDCQIGSNCTIANNVPIGGHAILEDHVIIGGNSAIHQFIMIGEGAMIGGMVGVKENIIPFSLVTPCNSSVYGGIRGINIIGLKRRGITKEEIQYISDAFSELESSKPLKEKVANLSLSNKYTRHIADFINKSQTMEHSKGLAHFIKD